MLVTSRYLVGARGGRRRTSKPLRARRLSRIALLVLPLPSGRGTQPGTRMRRFLVSALALVAACGTRPDPQRLDAVPTSAQRGEPGVVARRLLSESQFDDRGISKAGARHLGRPTPDTSAFASRRYFWTSIRVIV